MSILPKLKNEEMRKELKSRVSGYIIAAFSLVAALAWNDAIASFIKIIFPESSSTLIAKFIYALFITVIVALVAIYITKMLDGEGEKQK